MKREEQEQRVLDAVRRVWALYASGRYDKDLALTLRAELEKLGSAVAELDRKES